METLVLTIHILIALGLVITVLLQRSEGGGLGIGGGGRWRRFYDCSRNSQSVNPFDNDLGCWLFHHNGHACDHGWRG